LPLASELGFEWGRPTRTLLYGKDKSKKTWWACKAAEAGFNVVLIDGDDGSSITKNLPIEARKRILIVDAVDNQKKAVFSQFMASFLKPGNVFVWDEQGKTTVPSSKVPDPEHSYIMFNPEHLTTNEVIIVDSWTSLADSTKQQFAAETGYDLIAVEREGDQFGLPNFQARYLDWVLSKLHTLPCHVIVVGHEQIWEKYKGQGRDRKVVGTYTQPYSSTGPHAQKLGKHFENVLHFYKLSDSAYRISTVGDDSTAAGSRLISPNRYEWDKITPNDLFEAVGSVATGAPNRGAVFVPRGGVLRVETPVKINNSEIPALTNDASATAQVLDGSKVSEVKGLSLAEKIKLRKAN